VALGMVLAFGFSARLGLMPEADPKRAAGHLAAVGLPIHLKDIPGGPAGVDRLMNLMAQDKKVRAAS